MSMYEGHLIVEVVIATTSPLHIGTALGAIPDAAPEFAGKTADGEPREIAPVQRDARGLPIIPATTLKGAMRALAASALNKKDLDAVFGAIRESEPSQTGNPGVLVPYAARLLMPASLDGRVEAETNRCAAAGIYVTTRTAIDDASGTADHRKLFSQWVVAPGTRFLLRLAVLQKVENFTADPVGKVLARLLKTLDEGRFAIGRGRGDGQGILALVEVRTCRETTLTDTAEIREEDRLAELRAVVTDDSTKPFRPFRPLGVLHLTGADAFMVKVEDAALLGKVARRNPRDADADSKAKRNVQRGLRDGTDLPALPGSSLMGALRARAEWYFSREALCGRAPPDTPGDPSKDDWPLRHPVNRLFGADADTLREIRRHGSDRRTFGAAAPKTGWAGLLRVVAVEASRAKACVLPSVRIDRFSAAPFDKGLFETEAFVRPAFHVTLALDARATEHDTDTADAFLRSLTRGPGKGLMLGHGGNHGYGWFDVEFEKNPASDEEAAR
jgi:CRISPR/Cas system CSM-associated protein Csm3 (group 7 of RAMP superfamily)